jgi:SAM-dependent methyltransferase
MNNNPNQSNKDIPWEPIYLSIQSERLWPNEPTISNLNLELWKQDKLSKILDAGCGDGKNLAWLIEQGFLGVGVDASASALDQCRDYLDTQGFKNQYQLLSNQELDALDELMDGDFPGIICIDVLGHSQHPRQILNELIRILQPGGLLYFSVFHPDDSCRLGPRIRPGVNPGDYWYTPSVSNKFAPNMEYYYHFYSEDQVCKLIENLPIELLEIKYHGWKEPPHEIYREEEHYHVSWFILLRRV